MASVKSFAVLLVFFAAAGFIYCFLLPSGKVSQTAKSVLSAVLLLVTLGPLFSFMGQELPTFDVPAQEDVTAAGDLYVSAVKETLSREIGRTVRAYTDLPYTLELDAHISADGTIYIEQVKLCFPAQPPEPDALRDALTAALGAEPLLEVREDG